MLHIVAKTFENSESVLILLSQNDEHIWKQECYSNASLNHTYPRNTPFRTVLEWFKSDFMDFRVFCDASEATEHLMRKCSMRSPPMYQWTV